MLFWMKDKHGTDSTGQPDVDYPIRWSLAEGAKAWVVIMLDKYYGVYYHTLYNPSKCRQSFRSEQFIYF